MAFPISPLLWYLGRFKNTTSKKVFACDFFVVMHFLRLFLVKLYDFFLREYAYVSLNYRDMSYKSNSTNLVSLVYRGWV